MGLGPSIKMTTLHHFRCPAVSAILKDAEVEFTGIIVDGVSERYEDKVYTACRTAELAEVLGLNGALVAIDGWGNHHVDFVSVIEELGKRDILSVGLSYIGNQGRLVCDNPYVDTVIDFNKNTEGYESCVVGDNNLTELDAYKALGLLKNKIRKQTCSYQNPEINVKTQTVLHRLIRYYAKVEDVKESDYTHFEDGTLFINTDVAKAVCKEEPLIKEVIMKIIPPDKHDIFVNSNLDFEPIAIKKEGRAGEGITCVFSGIAVMLTGVEEGGFQPSNIGSSEGLLENRVKFGQAGTPEKGDYILQIDVKFQNGEGRTAEGIRAAHRLAERCILELRDCLKTVKNFQKREIYEDKRKPGMPKVGLIKIVSGLGNMYDTVMFPSQPGGILGGKSMMDTGNLPYIITPAQCMDGVIHSLL